MKRLIIFLYLIINVVLMSETINIMTEEFPPYNYLSEEGSIDGVSTEIVRAIFDNADLDYSIKIYPWARAYNRVLKDKNTAIYSIYHSEKRDKLFYWVGEIVRQNAYLYKLKKREDIKVNNIYQAKNYIVGVVGSDAGHQYLKQKGFVQGENMEQVSDANFNIKKLYFGRIDLILSDEITFAFRLKQLGMDVDDFEKIEKVDDLSGSLELAISKNTDYKIVEKCIKSLREIKENGVYGKIVENWLK